MIRYARGNLLGSEAEALVNTVNEVGVMGKGIALQFKEAFPDNAKAYIAAAKQGKIRVGSVFVFENTQLAGPRWIISFPTKRHWRHPSRIEWIHEGLLDLIRVVRELGVRSIALPPLGCGNGKLEWRRIRREIESSLAALEDVDVTVYMPTTEYFGLKQRDPKRSLTPARALMIELIRRYSILDTGCTILEVQKIAWFLTRVLDAIGIPDPLGLKFKASKYGPYSDRLRHLLDGLDGSYLNCEKRLSDAGPYDAIWFNDEGAAELDTYLKSGELRQYRKALDVTAAVISGFESPLGMELLSTVDWLISESLVEKSTPSIEAAIAVWPGGSSSSKRKQELFDGRLISLALEQLAQTIPAEVV